MAWAKAWGAALAMAPTWVLELGAVWLSAMLSQLQLQWASA
jgi:hypothetical protein